MNVKRYHLSRVGAGSGQAIFACEQLLGMEVDVVDAMDCERLEGALKVCEQALLEVHHAQLDGADWYTKGHSGLYQQVAMWVRKGLDAIKKAR